MYCVNSYHHIELLGIIHFILSSLNYIHSYMVAALAPLAISCVMKVAIGKQRIFTQIPGGYSSSRGEEVILR